MSNPTQQLAVELGAAALPATRIIERLRAAGHKALLAGGCVRDLLLGLTPQDFDVATDATPQRVTELFRDVRLVGAQFGVALVRSAGVWVEVATFRSDGAYEDGRRPSTVTFGTAEQDAQRRDFTLNGMFFDPLSSVLLDYVGGRDDLRSRLLRCIGEPALRFAEDHLRLLRAVRIAAKLALTIEPATFAALRAHASKLARVAAERVREELEKAFDHSSRAVALALLDQSHLLHFLWPGARDRGDWFDRALALVAALPQDGRPAGQFDGFCVVLALLLPVGDLDEAERVCRALTCSNEQRTTVRWLVEHQADLDDPEALTLADFKRLVAHPAWNCLHAIALARYSVAGDGQMAQRLADRLARLDPVLLAPPPLIVGDDLMAAGLTPSPRFKTILDALYTAQLNEEISTRTQGLERLAALLREDQTL